MASIYMLSAGRCTKDADNDVEIMRGGHLQQRPARSFFHESKVKQKQLHGPEFMTHLLKSRGRQKKK